MSDRLSTITLRNERDVVQARQRAREIAALLGFDNQEQIRLATATSEMARNAYRYARGGKVSFDVEIGRTQFWRSRFLMPARESTIWMKFLKAVIVPVPEWAWEFLAPNGSWIILSSPAALPELW